MDELSYNENKILTELLNAEFSRLLGIITQAKARMAHVEAIMNSIPDLEDK